MPKRYQTIISTDQQEPSWHSHRRSSILPIPLKLQSWLFDHGSLTKRLIDKSNSQFRVQILSQGWQQPNWSEAIRLGIPFRQRALVREVILSGGGQPWVYARSILPNSTLTGSLRRLKKLDSRPLGALLFKEPNMTRSAIEVACFQLSHRVIPKQFQKEHELWGRRSVFYLHKKPLLVSEIFLPEFNP